MVSFMFVSEPTDVPGLGLLKPLTIKQMAELRVEIQRDLMLLTEQGLSGAEKGYAAAAIAMQVAEMNRFKQASYVVNSPMLMAHAVSLMLGDRVPNAHGRIDKITPANLEAVADAIVGSYGCKFVPTKDSTTDEDAQADPQKTAGSSEAAAA